MLKKTTLSLLCAVSLFHGSLQKAQSEPVTIITTLIGVGATGYAAIQAKKHCNLICNARFCGSPSINSSKEIINYLQGVPSVVVGSTTRNLAEFCLSTCSTDETLSFRIPIQSIPKDQKIDEPLVIEEKTINFNVHKRYGDSWSVKNCALAYNKSNINSVKTLLLPKNTEVFVYSQSAMNYLKTLEQNNDYEAFIQWQSIQKMNLVNRGVIDELAG